MKNKDKIIVIILFIVLIVLFIILIKPENKLKTFCYNNYKIETFKQYDISNDGETLNFLSEKYTITLKNIDQDFNTFEKEDFSSLNIQDKILNQNEKIASLKLSYQTATGKSVVMETNYSYDFVEVELPEVENDA